MLYIQNTFLSNSSFSFIMRSVSQSTRLTPKGKSICVTRPGRSANATLAVRRPSTQNKSQQLQMRKREVTTTRLTTDRVNSQCYHDMPISTHHPLKNPTHIKTHNHLQNLQATEWHMRGSPRCFKGDCRANPVFVNVTNGKQWKGHTEDCFLKQNREHKLKAKQRRGSILWKATNRSTL